MNKNKLIIVITILLFISVACDHTDLDGTIELRTNDFMVGEQIPVILTVPDELSGIHRVMWDVSFNGDLPVDTPDMIYGGDVLEEVYSDKELESMFGLDYDLDRIAVFIPVLAGEYTIECYGFYKQTNPQPITKITVTIGTSPSGNGIHAFFDVINPAYSYSHLFPVNEASLL